jgi:uncharacterized membrane protein HdeD (DUF308 family)
MCLMILTAYLKINNMGEKPNRRRVNTVAKKTITISGATMGILAIIAGILVLIWPDFVRWIVGIFLIVWGVLALINK